MSIVLVEQSLAIASRCTDRAYAMSLGKVVHEVKQGKWAEFLADGEAVKSYLGG